MTEKWSCCEHFWMAEDECLCPFVFKLLPCIDPGWLSSASFLFWWHTLSSLCKYLDYAVSCILLLLILFGIHFPHRFDCYQRATRLCSTSYL